MMTAMRKRRTQLLRRIQPRACRPALLQSWQLRLAGRSFAPALPVAAQSRPAALDITGYVIDAELDTATHHLAAKAVVSFTAPANLEVVNFGFHPALKITKITDEAASCLTANAPPTAPSASPPARPLSKGKTVRWTFEYEGVITGNEDGPVEGLKLAAIQEPISYLLYPARWFPTTGFHDRPLHRRNAYPRSAGHARLRQRQRGRIPARHARQRQARRRVRLQLDQARLSRAP